MKSMSNYHDVLKLYGFTPEVYNVLNQEAARDSFPLRPELIESAMYLYKATNGDPYLLDIGSDILRSIQHSSRTRCGYATVKFFTKYRVILYSKLIYEIVYQVNYLPIISVNKIIQCFKLIELVLNNFLFIYF